MTNNLSMSMFVRKEDMEKTKSVKDIVKDVLYSKEGATSYHQGNPFARAFNDALNR